MKDRLFSTKVGDTKVEVPVQELRFSFSRSSGAGGQNVNKLNTKAELRFHLMGARWLEEEVKERFLELFPNFVNNSGEVVIVSQEERNQHRNKSICVQKLGAMVKEAAVPVKDRVQYEGISDQEKSKRVKFKKKRSEVKKLRRGKIDW